MSILRALTSDTTSDRVEACGVISDIFRELSDHEATVLASVLAWATLQESDSECREAELYCLSTLVEWELAPPYAYESVASIQVATLRGSEVEYFEHLLSELK